MNIKSVLESRIRELLEFLIDDAPIREYEPNDMLDVCKRKKQLLQSRDAQIVKCDADVSVLRQLTVGSYQEVDYVIHFQYFIQQNRFMYVEEERIERHLICNQHGIVSDCYIQYENNEETTPSFEREVTKGKGETISYTYNRLEAVKYAEAWWNGRNPAYQNFQDNCTNFISQCLHAGESPMSGYPNVGRGWWQMKKQWSWSWAVAHSFHGYLSNARIGLRARQVEKPQDLLLGDVVVYDFENDGRWNHTTIVVAKDEQGMPLVNAHSADSRRRYWAYEDSSKYTPRMKYKFFHIVNND
ncbi:amidase domain-containing protein [Microbacteriaceae bacterium 4G12]